MPDGGVIPAGGPESAPLQPVGWVSATVVVGEGAPAPLIAAELEETAPFEEGTEAEAVAAATAGAVVEDELLEVLPPQAVTSAMVATAMLASAAGRAGRNMNPPAIGFGRTSRT